MGIASVDTVVPAADATKAPTKESTPTFLSGESLTFPLITGAGTAAITLIAAIRGVKPSIEIVVAVAVVCGIIVTVWGMLDVTAASTEKKSLKPADYFKRSVIGILNTILLAAALWGTVAASEAAFAPS